LQVTLKKISKNQGSQYRADYSLTAHWKTMNIG
jgi:hypothetical protein